MAVQSKTKKADKIVVGQALFDKIWYEFQLSNAEAMLEKIHKLETKINGIYSGSKGVFPKIENKPFYYFTKGNFYLADPARYLIPNTGDIPSSVSDVPTTNMKYSQFGTLYNYHRSCPIYSGYEDARRCITNKDNVKYTYIVGYYDNRCRTFYIYNNGNNATYADNWSSIFDAGSSYLRFPICNQSGLRNALKYDLMPSDLDEYEKKLFTRLVKYEKSGVLKWDNDSIEGFSDKFFGLLKKDAVYDFEDILFKKDSVAKYIKDGNTVHLSDNGMKELMQSFINVDTVKINLSPYEESRLTDPNGGHWDLWSSKAGENETVVKLDTAFYGRNPVEDVQKDGIIGIDFGTKSTVVTVQNGTDDISPMRIGCGDYKKDVAFSDYENPTVMEFIDLERFLSRYRASESRPETEWIDLTISHTASESLNAPKSGNEYYAWFSDLKQWASDKNRKILIKDKHGKETELCPFVDINDEDINPIEYYAYLLGLFINNMYNKIYVNYILSFPVTYERKIRQKIAYSFSKGLKKSLPKPVQEDKNIMNLFRVMEGASEPAAYAVCALQEYGFKPEENEKILYGIFDFGGGTTDFDFGTWQRAPKKLQRRYDYVIKHFGAGGDRLLGGENLLELLAYSVFKKNEAVLRQNGIQFVKPPDAQKYCGLFDGSEALISDSQQAKINQKFMAEELRPLWHGEEYDKEKIKINLYNTNGDAETVELDVDVDELKELIRKRIDSGVDDFFKAMAKAVTEEVAEGVDKIHIFLAGNSSKSKVVIESFNTFQKQYEKIFAEKLNIEIEKEEELKEEIKGNKYDEYDLYGEYIAETTEAVVEEVKEEETQEDILKSNVFVLYPPLGTEKSDTIRKSMGLNVSTAVTRPTGKTGVAYGLLECRPGSRIKVESEIKETDEIKFNYYLGYATLGKFEVVADRDIEYGKWIEFIDASESDFELYFTDLPEAVGNQMSISGVSKKNCRIDETMEDAMVYIRAVEPSVLEYCAAIDEEELNKQEYLSPPKRIILE